MNEETKAFLRSQLETGKNAEEAKRELISYGYDSDGFNEAYAELAEELGIKKTEPKIKADVSTSPPAEDYGEIALPGVFALIKQSFFQTFSHLPSVLLATVIMAVVMAVDMLLPTEPTLYFGGPAFLVLWLVAALLTTVIAITSSMALFYVIVRTEDQVKYFHGLQWSMQNIFPVLGLGLAITGIFISASIALIIPGLVFLVYSVFSFVVLAKGTHSGVIAIVRSTDLVSGYFWGILLRLVVGTLVFGVVMLPLALLFVVLTTVFSEFSVLVFILLTLSILLQMFFIALVTGVLAGLHDPCARGKRLFDMSLYGGLKWIYRLMIVFGFLLPFGLLLLSGESTNFISQFLPSETVSQYAPERGVKEDSLDDFRIRARLDEAAVSSNYYYNRLGIYDGVCDDVAIEDPVRCHSAGVGYILYAPISSGQYYCRDSAGYRGEIKTLPSDFSCE